MTINARTRLFFLLGNPVDHSLSPALHNAAFSALKINSVYLACPVEEKRIGAAVESIRALAVGGANVTSPYKDQVIPYLDSLSSEAENLNAVNTIINRNGYLHGEITDGEGCYRALFESSPATAGGLIYLIIGLGGAARAVANSLNRHGAKEIYIANRTPDKAKSWSERLVNERPSLVSGYLPLLQNSLIEVIDKCDVLIYGLPVDDPALLSALATMPNFAGKKRLFDMRYHPETTALMTAFRDNGGHAENGLSMLLWQAVLAFELFTARQAPVEVMRLALNTV
ncbi:MAG: shikimate dehydrogenase [Dethiobacteria bacterium]|nr:shikimate dehydrogenase [Dethiobacteria bacterium]